MQELSHYLKPVLAVLIITFLVAGGWKYYQRMENRAQSKATNLYNQMVMQFEQGDYKSARLNAERLAEKYGDMAYAQFSQLFLARMAAEEGEPAKAEQILNKLLSEPNLPTGFENLTKLSLAYQQLAQKKAEKALQTLQGDGGNYAGLYAEAKAEAKLLLGQLEEAKTLFLQAKDTIEDNSYQQMLQLKIDGLSGMQQTASTTDKMDVDTGANQEQATTPQEAQQPSDTNTAPNNHPEPMSQEATAG